MPAADLESAATAPPSGCGRDGRQREHRATGAVQVSGQYVDHLDQPAAHRAEFDCGGAHPAVHGGRRRPGQLSSQCPDLVSLHPAVRGNGLRREITGQFADLLHPGHVIGQSSQVDQVLLEKDVDNGEQQGGVGTGPRRQVPVGQSGGAGAGGVDDHQRSTTLAQAAQFAAEVGRSGQAAIGDQRIRPDDHQIVGSIEIGHRECDGAAEHQAHRHVFGHLVERARRVDVTGAEPADDQRRVQRARDGVGVRVAEEYAHRRAAVVAYYLAQAGRHGGERLVPGCFGERSVPAHQRCPQAVGVVVEFGETRALRADVTRTEDVVVVTPGADDPPVIDGQRQAAGRFTQGADPQGRFCRGRFCRGRSCRGLRRRGRFGHDRILRRSAAACRPSS